MSVLSIGIFLELVGVVRQAMGCPNISGVVRKRDENKVLFPKTRDVHDGAGQQRQFCLVRVEEPWNKTQENMTIAFQSAKETLGNRDIIVIRFDYSEKF